MTSIRLAIFVALATTAAHAAAQPPAGGESTAVFSPVTWERLVNAADEPQNWLMYNGTLDGKRFSQLDQIDVSNVTNLKLKWAHHIPQLDRAETTPLVVDGVMFITESPSNVVAVDAVTGRPFWRYDHPLPDDLRVCCGRNNRGVAILGETLYMSTLDAHLVAIDGRSGSLRWNQEVADHRSGYSKTAAPLIVKDRIVTGIAGGEYGIRGFLDAYDADTGEREWRTYTIPGPDHPDNRTWAGDSWRTGGSPTWITGSYDPDLNLVYWGTGNPGPDWNGDLRQGDNLYADSVLALDGDTGEMSWYFQFTPHDVHDWDAIQIPVLADIELDGETRKAMLWANRNGFYYTLDRETGEFLLGKAFALQTWAEGLDSNGRPIRRPGTFPSQEGTLVAPIAGGATNWWSPAYSPRTGLLYVNASVWMLLRGGENIYCAEVEAGIFEHSDVAECAVFGVPDERLGEEVGAAVVVRKDADLGAPAIREHCAARMAAHKIPRYIWIGTEPLPRNANGKFLKRQLRDELDPANSG